MGNMSSALIWQCVRNNSSFLKKQRNCISMTNEPGNLTSVNAQRFSGLANDRTVGLDLTGKKQHITLSLKKKSLRKVKNAQHKTVLSRDSKKAVAKLDELLIKANYRKDLAEL